MQATVERRAAGNSRIAFDGVVEMGVEAGGIFEGQAVDLSREGIHVACEQLPELGSMLTCRFFLGDRSVICEGNVVWRMEAPGGGEFGLRFTALDGESSTVLADMFRGVEIAPATVRDEPQDSADTELVKPVHAARGARVRLHIEGLGAPMRARVRDVHTSGIVAQSELGFLRLGKDLEFEDATTGERGAARIDRVAVEVDPETQVPQLMVRLAYVAAPAATELAEDDRTDAEDTKVAPVEAPVQPAPQPIAAPQPVARSLAASPLNETIESAGYSEEDIERESSRIKGSFAGAVAKITPAVSLAGNRAKHAVLSLWSRQRARFEARKQESMEAEAPARRTTAPAPNGALSAKGRRVVRGEAQGVVAPPATPQQRALVFAKTHKRPLAAGGALMTAALLAGLAFGQSSDEPKPLLAPVAQEQAPAPIAPAVVAPPADPASLPVAPARSSVAAVDDLLMDDSEETAAPVKVKPARVAKPQAFGRGKIENGKAFRLKMDGTIYDIQGATLPEGFTVSLPDVRSLEGAARLFKDDARVARARIDNTEFGAELEVTFKDGVPGYAVRARGDVLEVVLSRPGEAGKEVAKADPKKAPVSSSKTAQASAKDSKSTKKDTGLERTSLKRSAPADTGKTRRDRQR